MAPPPRVVVLNPLPFYQPYRDERAMAERLGASFHADGPPGTDLLAEATVLLSHSAPIDASLLDALVACRLIVTYSTGVDHIDVEAAEARGITVRGLAGYCTDDVAEHALAMLLSCARRLHQLDRELRSHGTWDVIGSAPGRRRLSSQTLGIVGVGRIGRALGRKAAALGMRVLGNDPLLDAPPSDFPGPLVPFSALLEQSDYVSLHAPLLPASRNLIGADELSRMKPTAFLINCARGALVDETALLRALEAHLIAGAALDVRVQEPTPPGDPLVGRQDVLVTPHAAAFTIEAIRDLHALVVEYVREALAGVAV
jgi:D-3-phosphoglycerate dehydrogenase / 2-oxoglutarate reductase